MEISFDFKGDPTGGLINSCKYTFLSCPLFRNVIILIISLSFHASSAAVLLEKVRHAF
jgi:hypothetical protein